MRARRIAALLRAAALPGLLAGLLASPLAGCVSWAPAPVAAVSPAGGNPHPAETLVPETLVPETLVPEMRLAESVERAERALAALARALPAPDPESGLPAARAVPAELRRPVTLDWTGPVETLAEELARRAGYRFAEAGRSPARPLIVAVEAEGEPLIAVLRDAGLRAGSAATLTVDAARRTVLLDWTAPEGDG